MRKYLFFVGLIVSLMACSPLHPGVQVDNKFQDESSKTIVLLVSDKELSAASKDFVWEAIKSEQERPDPTYELVSRKYTGYYQISDSNITIWHTVRRYAQLIDKSKLPALEFGVATEDITSTFSPEIETSSPTSAQCVVYRKVSQVCKVNIFYRHIESDLYLSTSKYYSEEILSAWLNSIVKSVEPKILAQDNQE